MKNLSFFFLLFIALNSSAQQWQWAKNIIAGNSPSVRNVTEPDVNGNFYLGVNSGTGACIIKFDGNGSELWRHCIPGQIQINGISSTGSEVFIAGTFQNSLTLLSNTISSSGMQDIFMLRLSSAGSFGWLKKYGGSANDQAGDIANDGKGSIYLTGSFNGSVSFGNHVASDTCGPALLIAKFDLAGNLQFIKQSHCLWSSSSFAMGKQISVDSHSNIFVLGTYSYFMLDTIEVSGGGGPYDAWFLGKIDSAGKVLWARQVPNQTVDELFELTLDANGDILVNGYYHWTMGGTTLTYKFDATNGNLLWNDGIGGYCPGDQGISEGIAEDGTNSYIFGKIHLGTNCSPGRTKLLLVRYNSTGQQLLHDTIALQVNAYNFDIIPTEPGGFIVSGIMSQGSIIFGTHTVTAYNDDQVFIAKFYSDGVTTSVPKSLEQKKLRVFPNPSTGLFEINTTTNASIKVFDAIGNCLYSGSSDQTTTIDLRSLKKGIYILQTTSEGVTASKKLIKE